LITFLTNYVNNTINYKQTYLILNITFKSHETFINHTKHPNLMKAFTHESFINRTKHPNLM